MDSRTKKIRELRWKLELARSYLRDIAKKCVTIERDYNLARDYWGVRAIEVLESTKE
jgi:hypothetical protein